MYSFVNVFFLPGAEPVEGNKFSLGSQECTFSITVQRGGSFGQNIGVAYVLTVYTFTQYVS